MVVKELSTIEVAQASGGDGQTYSWGKMVGEGARTAWDAMKDYAAPSESFTDVIA
jgi:hypothetical protein